MDNREVVVVEVGENPPKRLDKALALFAPDRMGLSRTRIAKLIRDGKVSCQGEAELLPDKAVEKGQQWTILLDEDGVGETLPEKIDLDIRYEDSELIVVNKPAGLVVHPAPGNRQGTLLNGLLHHCKGLSQVRSPSMSGIVHRLDKDTSGLLVAAKSDRSHLGLAQQFAKRLVDRRYTAVVRGLPGASASMLGRREGSEIEGGGVIRMEGKIGRSDRDRKKMAVKLRNGKWAVTRLRVKEHFIAAHASLLECWLETGRTHQIRVHLAHFGHPLVGDRVYGRRHPAEFIGLGGEIRTAVSDFERQALHAGTLGFVHPVTGERMEFAAELPNDMKELVNALRSCGAKFR